MSTLRKWINPSTLFTVGIITVIIVGINYFFLKQNPLTHETAPARLPSLKNELIRAPGPSRRKVEEAKPFIEKDPKRAITLLDQAIDLDSQNVEALGTLAGIYLNQGEKQKARDLATNCLDVESKNPECIIVMISSYTRYGEFEEADHFLSNCLLDDPNNVHCLSGKLTVHLNLYRFREAKEVLDQLNAIAPDTVWTHLAAAQYHEKTNSLDLAKQHYQKACEMGQAFACSQATPSPSVSP